MKDFHFGDNLKSIRQAKQITQEFMALNLNITQVRYSRIEHRANIPELELVHQMAEVLGVETAELMPSIGREQPIAKRGFEDWARDMLRTTFGIIIYCVITIFIVNLVYEMGNSFCEGYGASEQTTKVVRFLSGLAALIFMWYWGWRTRKR